MYRFNDGIIARCFSPALPPSLLQRGTELGARGPKPAAILRQSCSALPTHHQLQTALVGARDQSNGGFNLDMWGYRGQS